MLSTAGRGGLGEAGLEVILGLRAQLLSMAGEGGLGDAGLEGMLGSRGSVALHGWRRRAR